jgi:cupin fold WbuC family metalloprotein
MKGPNKGDGASLKVFSPGYLSDMHAKAAISTRARQHALLHDSHDDPCQKLFIALRQDSYIPPHRHLLDPKRETLIAIEGLMAFVTFENDGHVRDVLAFGSEAHGGGSKIPIGVDLPPDLWHSVVTLTPTAILFEAKAGPFRSALAKEPCDWAPQEGTASAAEFLEELRRIAAERLRGANEKA